MGVVATLLLPLALLAQAPAAAGAQWPGLWGPARNGSAPAAPAGTAEVAALWRMPVDGGYSEVAVSAGLAVTLAKLGADDFVLAPGVRAVTGPSYAGGRMYVRNLAEIVALQLEPAR